MHKCSAKEKKNNQQQQQQKQPHTVMYVWRREATRLYVRGAVEMCALLCAWSKPIVRRLVENSVRNRAKRAPAMAS